MFVHLTVNKLINILVITLADMPKLYVECYVGIAICGHGIHLYIAMIHLQLSVISFINADPLESLSKKIEKFSS